MTLKQRLAKLRQNFVYKGGKSYGITSTPIRTEGDKGMLEFTYGFDRYVIRIYRNSKRFDIYEPFGLYKPYTKRSKTEVPTIKEIDRAIFDMKYNSKS